MGAPLNIKGQPTHKQVCEPEWDPLMAGMPWERLFYLSIYPFMAQLFKFFTLRDVCVCLGLVVIVEQKGECPESWEPHSPS